MFRGSRVNPAPCTLHPCTLNPTLLQVWLDMFALDLYPLKQQEQQQQLDAVPIVLEALCTCHASVLVLSPSALPLSRAWCLFEASAALQQQGPGSLKVLGPGPLAAVAAGE